MSEYDKMTTDEIAIKTASEGLGYMIECYISANGIKDPKLAALWEKAYISLMEVRNYIKANSTIDTDDD